MLPRGKLRHRAVSHMAQLRSHRTVGAAPLTGSGGAFGPTCVPAPSTSSHLTLGQGVPQPPGGQSRGQQGHAPAPPRPRLLRGTRPTPVTPRGLTRHSGKGPRCHTAIFWQGLCHQSPGLLALPPWPLSPSGPQPPLGRDLPAIGGWGR